jgi:hypothetical protein
MNLGPIHLLGPMVSEIYDRRNKAYMFKLTEKGYFASKDLKEYKLGAAVRSTRKREEERSRFPKEFWTESL